jgi:hypothetical protein
MRLIDEKFVSVMGECVSETTDSPPIFRFIGKTVSLTRMLSTLDSRCEENAARRKWNWSRSFLRKLNSKLQKIGEFPDEPARIKVSPQPFFLFCKNR